MQSQIKPNHTESVICYTKGRATHIETDVFNKYGYVRIKTYLN
jgi:hypothetical protein